MRSGILVFPAIERIVYGRPAAQALPAEVARLGANRIFLMVSGTLNRTTGEVARLCAALGNRCVGIYDRMPPHTPRDAVLDAAGAARTAGADLIVTFGGGSVTDGGKMVRLCLQHKIAEVDGFDALRAVTHADGTSTIPDIERPAVPQVAIPTTLSGGEFNDQAGCTDHRNKEKHSFRHPLLVPCVTILDPVPGVHAPLRVWLASGLRGVDHAAEGLCSQFSNRMGDASFIEALQLLSRALPRVKRNPADLDARLECQIAIWHSMAGRHGGAQMGASHAVGKVLGGTCGVAHGYTSCIMLPHVLRYNRPANVERQRLVAAAMGHPEENAADVIAALIADLDLPRCLSDVGVGREQFALIADRAMREHGIHTNPRNITAAEQVLEILDAAA